MPEPLEQPVEFDITGALASIDTLDQALAQVAANFDTSLTAALGQLASTPLEVDTSQISAQIEAAVTEATPPIVLDADTTAIDSGIADALDAPRPPIDVEGDTSGLEGSIADATIQTPTIPVDGDTAELSAQIDSATNVTATVPVDADVTAAELAVGGLGSETVTVGVDADTAAAQQAIDALGGETATIGVDADTSDAEQAIGSLGDTATRAAGGSGGEGLTGLGGAVLGVEAASGLARGEVGGLTSSIGGLSSGLGEAVAGGAAFTAFLGESVKLAADAQAQQALFNQTFGASAEIVKSIDVGGLKTDLESLSKQTGTTNADLEASASRIGLLGAASGAAQPQVAGTASDLLGLAAALSVANPRLGDTATVADTISRALATGRTRSLIPYGISISQTAILQKALDDNLGKTKDTLTGYDKLVAGLTLALQQQGDTLGTKYAAGIDNAQVKLRALKVEVEEALVAVGTPLLDPVTSSLEAFIPVAVKTGEVLGEIARVALPFIEALGPALTIIEPPLDALSSSLGFVADQVDRIPEPVLVAAEALIVGATAAGILGTSITALALGAGVGEAALIGLGGAGEALGAAFSVALGPIGLAVAGIAIVASVLGVFDSGTKEAKQDVAGMSEALFGTADSADALSTALSKTDDSLSKYLATQLKTGDQAEHNSEVITRLHLNYSTLADAVSGTDQDFFALTDSIRAHAEAAGIDSNATDDLVHSLFLQRATLQAAAGAQLDNLLATHQITQAQFDRVKAEHDVNEAVAGSREQTGDYVAALNEATPAAERHAAAQNANAEAHSRNSASLELLIQKLALGTITEEQAAAGLEHFGFTSDAAAAKAKSLAAQIDSFVQSATSALPSTGSAIDTFAQAVKSDWDQVVKDTHDGTGNVADDLKKLADDQDPQRFADNLKKQAEDIAAFSANLSTLISEGLGPLAAELAQKGPEAAGGLAAGLASDPSKAKIAASSLELRDAAVTNIDTLFRQNFPQLEGLGIDAGGHIITGVATGITEGTPAAGAASEAAAVEVSNRFDPSFSHRVPVAMQAAAIALANDPTISEAAGKKGLAAVEAFEATFGPLSTAQAVQIAMTGAAGGIQADTTVGAKAGQKGTEVGGKFKPDFAGQTKEQLAAALPVVSNVGALTVAAGTAGHSVGVGFDSGLAEGLADPSQLAAIKTAAAAAVVAAETAARTQAESKSPSRVAMRIGQDWTAGLAIGVSDTTQITAAGTIIVGALTDSTTAALASTGGQITSAIVAGFNDQATIDAATARLTELVNQATTRATAGAVDQVVSSATSQIPTAASAISDFGQTVSSALQQQNQAFDQYHDALKTFHADQADLIAIVPKVAAASELLRLVQVRLVNDTAAGLSKSTLDADAALVANAQKAVDELQGKVGDAQKQVDTDRAGIGSSTHDLEAAQKALVAASNPDEFIRNLDRQTQANRRFQADIRKLAAEGFTDLAKQLAQAGPAAAGKLADGLASNSVKARAAERAVDSAAAFGDSYTAFIEKTFAPKAAATAENAGVVIGGALSAGVQSSTKSAADLAAVQIRTHIGTITPQVAIDTATIRVGGAAPIVRVVPRVDPLGPVELAPATLEVQPHLALPLADLAPIAVEVTPHLAPLDTRAIAAAEGAIDSFTIAGSLVVTVDTSQVAAGLAGLPQSSTLEVVPTLAPLDVAAFPPAALEVDPAVRLPLPPLAPIHVQVIPDLGPLPPVQATVAPLPAPEIAPARLEVEPTLDALPPLLAASLEVVPAVDPIGALTPAQVAVEPVVAPLPTLTAEVDATVLPLAEDLFPSQTVQVAPELTLDTLPDLTFPPATVDVEPILLPLPDLEPISVTVIPKLEPLPQVVVPAVAEQLVVAGTSAPAPATAGTGPQILELDLTLNLDDGRVATATATVPIPSAAGKQILKAAVEAKVQAG